MPQPDSLANAFLRQVPNALAQLDHAMAGLDAHEKALRTKSRRADREVEIRRAVALADHAVRVWAAEAVGTTHQQYMAQWTGQLHEATTPEEAGRLGDDLVALGSSVDGYAKIAVSAARRTCEAARQITDDIPGADNRAEFAQVAENAAATLAARARAAHDEDQVIDIAIETAEWLATIQASSS